MRVLKHTCAWPLLCFLGPVEDLHAGRAHTFKDKVHAKPDPKCSMEEKRADKTAMDKTAMEILNEADNTTAAESAAESVAKPASSNFMVSKTMSHEDKQQFMMAVRNARSWIIDPRTSQWMAYWDMCMIIALSFTATVTPFQIAFLPAPLVLKNGVGISWVFNRFVDLFFLIDVGVTCNTMYQMPLVDGGMWVDRRSQIIVNYFQSGWLVIDCVSCFPYFLIGLVLEAAAGPDDQGDSTSMLMPLRLVKLIRMLKLTRCLKAASKVQPYLQELLMGRFELTYAKMQVGALFVFLLFYTHVQACFWGLLSSFTDFGGAPTWEKSFIDDYRANNGGDPSPWDVYVAALYWSAMTITSIGYGEMLPLNTGERMICSFLMLISGMVWTYILGTAAGIAATLEPNLVLFRTTSALTAVENAFPACTAASAHLHLPHVFPFYS